MAIEIAPSPLQALKSEWLDKQGVCLYIKRDDLLHPHVQGNKWRKLKYNLVQAQEEGHHTIITFGGPFSNHIYATAAAAKVLGLKCLGVIRGDKDLPLTPTLQFAVKQGMELHFADRATYLTKDSDEYLNSLTQQYGEYYYIPEGGTNLLALTGVAEIIDELHGDFDYLCTACGTGGTIAGLVAGLQGRAQVLGFSALKGKDTLTPFVSELVNQYCDEGFDNFSINFNYHFGGYAKVLPPLIDFIKNFKEVYGIQLEPVYTGKMMYGIFDLIEQGYFKKGSNIIALHTGGLQGLSGYPDYFPEFEFGLPD